MWVSRAEYVENMMQAQLWSDRHTKSLDTIERLEMQITELKMALEAEKKRADKAVDRILQLAGSAPISPSPAVPTMEDLDHMFDEDPKVVRELRTAIKEKGAEVVLLGDDASYTEES